MSQQEEEDDGYVAVADVAATERSPKALDQAELITWGQNAYGELGHGDAAERSRPEVVRFVADRKLKLKQVVAGNEHTAILTESGQVFCCGYNDSGQCGVGHTNRVMSFQLVEGLEGKRVTQIYSANGCEHILAVTEEGTVYAWGYNSRGQLGLGTVSHMNAPQILSSMRNKQIVKVACSYYHTLLSTNTDDVYAFGRNDYGQLGVGDTLDRHSPEPVKTLPAGMILSIACGQYHSVFSVSGAGVFSCGKNDYGQLGSAGGEHRFVPIAVAEPLDAASRTAVTGLSCGYYHTVALTEAGQVFSWGRNDYGQLGHGNRDNVRVPKRIETVPAAVVGISSGCYHTLLLTENGIVFAQGRNNHGQLGTDTIEDAVFPIRVDALSEHKVTVVSAGFYHSACLTEPPNTCPRPPSSTLSADLRSMLNNPARSDVEFIVEGKSIYAHRCIIIARCEPLAKMLDGPMRESSEKVVPLPFQQYSVMLGLLEFLYTDSVDALDPRSVDLNYALDLLSLADQYLVERLKRLCEIAIQKSITVENVAMMFRTADERQALALRKRCFEYILKHFGKVIGTEGFVELPPALLREILFTASERGVTVRPA